MTASYPRLPVAVLGAGPIGLAAAAHLISRGFKPLVFETGASVGTHLETYRHVRLFSPWQYNIDRAARQLLQEGGWTPPADGELPTAGELVDLYLKPLARLPVLAPRILYGRHVVQVTRAGFDKVKTRGREAAPFLIRTRGESGEFDHAVSAVIDATGTWSHPNPLGAGGIPALGEQAAAALIDYGMPDVLGTRRAAYAGKRVLVVGSGHSAAGNLINLARLADEVPGTRIVWAVRSTHLARIFGGGAADGLAARGQLGMHLKALQDAGRLEMHTGIHIQSLREHGNALQVTGLGHDGRRHVIGGIERIVAATGARPDLALTRELRVRHDPWLESTDALAPLIDPNEHSCGTVRPHGHRELAHPEVRYYAVGAKSYGRAPNFLMATGYEQVRSVVAALAGETDAADDVQLELPETGVCNAHLGDEPAEEQASRCCGGPVPAGTGSCCMADVKAKEQGKTGCGCRDGAPTQAMPAVSQTCCV